MKLILVQGIRGHRVTGMFRLVIHIRNAYYWCNLLLSTKWFAKLNHHSLCTVCAKGHAISRVYISHKRSSHLVSYRSKKKNWKSTHGAFLLHLDVVNMTVDCQFTPGWVLLVFPLRVAGPGGLIDRLSRCTVIVHVHVCSCISGSASVRLLRLDSMCSAVAQDMCSLEI